MYLCGVLMACNGGTAESTTVATDSTTTTNLATPNSESANAEENKQAVMEATKLAKQLRDTYAKMEDKQARYVEEVPITSYLGKDIEVAEFEITKVDANLTRVYVDYFDGAPMGGKCYFINNGELFAVEIVRLTEVEGEHGAEVDEKISHIFYYKNGKLVQIWDTQAQQEVDSKTITWANENLEHWELVKKNL